jgi:CheY-like chemotaxis protein
MTESPDRLSGKRVLLVDDEQDILETLQDLLPMCETETAESYDQAVSQINTGAFDIAILDIMGVDGYKLLELAAGRNILTVMLTAYALTPGDVLKSHKKGAAYFIPKEKLIEIPEMLDEILAAKEKGESTWKNWMSRMAAFCERKFGPDWQTKKGIDWDKLTYH